MPDADGATLRFSRAKFNARLPVARRYTAAHLWLWEQPDSVWRVGFTKFALRMLGDPVEYDFELQPGAPVAKGQVVGWVEGFKAVSDVFCPIDGSFAGANPALADDIALMQKRPHDDGWLFAVQGELDPDCVDAEGYVEHLNATIDKMLGKSG